VSYAYEALVVPLEAQQRSEQSVLAFISHPVVGSLFYRALMLLILMFHSCQSFQLQIAFFSRPLKAYYYSAPPFSGYFGSSAAPLA